MTAYSGEMTLFMQVATEVSGIATMYMEGPPYVEVSGEMPLFLKNTEDQVSGVLTLYTMAPSGCTSSIRMYMCGPSGTAGAIPANNYMPLFMSRSNESVAGITTLFLKVIDQASGYMDLFIKNIEEQTSSPVLTKYFVPLLPNRRRLNAWASDAGLRDNDTLELFISGF